MGKYNFSAMKFEEIIKRLEALNPMARDYERKSIVYTPISTLTDSEYQIYVETLEEVLDIVYYVHKKLKGLQEGK